MTDQNGDKTPEQAEQVKGSGDSGVAKDSGSATVNEPAAVKRRNKWGEPVVMISLCGLLFSGIIYSVTRAGESIRMVPASYEESCRIVEEELGPKFGNDKDLFELAVKRFPNNMCVMYKKGINASDTMFSLTNANLVTPDLEFAVDAVSYLERSLDIQNSFYAHLMLGKTLARIRKFDEAKPHLEDALDYIKEDWTSTNDTVRAEAANWLAYVAFVQQDKAALLKYSEMAIDKETAEENIPNNHTYRGMALLWTSKNEEAKGEFMFSKSRFETQVPSTQHRQWNKARHLIMDYHGLAVLGDKGAEAKRDKLISDYLESKVVTREDVDRIVVNNPPDENITWTQIMN